MKEEDTSSGLASRGLVVKLIWLLIITWIVPPVEYLGRPDIVIVSATIPYISIRIKEQKWKNKSEEGPVQQRNHHHESIRRAPLIDHPYEVLVV